MIKLLKDYNSPNFKIDSEQLLDILIYERLYSLLISIFYN